MIMGKTVLEFDFSQASQLELYRKRLELLYATVEGSCPGDRNFGLAVDYQDEPQAVAETTFALEIINKTEEYVPEVNVDDVTFSHGAEGEMFPKILISLNEEYDEEEDEDDES